MSVAYENEHAPSYSSETIAPPRLMYTQIVMGYGNKHAQRGGTKNNESIIHIYRANAKKRDTTLSKTIGTMAYSILSPQSHHENTHKTRRESTVNATHNMKTERLTRWYRYDDKQLLL